MLFNDRQQAGTLLAEKLTAYQSSNALILGLARGGVAVAQSVAKVLSVPFDVLVIKKIGSPYNKEFAIGAVAPDGIFIVHWKDAHRSGADEAYVKHEVARLNGEIQKQLSVYRKGQKPIAIAGNIVILIDDGAATGATMEAAVRWARKKKAQKVVIGLPVASWEAIELLRPEVDELLVYEKAQELESVGAYYESFEQLTDAEVITLLREEHT